MSAVNWTVNCWLHTHNPIRPALLNTGDSPQLMNVLSQLLPNTFQMRWQHNLNSKQKTTRKEERDKQTDNIWKSVFRSLHLYLNCVHRARGEWSVVEGQCGTQQVSHSTKVVLVLLDGFNAHPVSGQQGLITGGISGRGHELKVPMSTTEQKTSPEATGAE